uniref:Uncharacterized protein n=1 Tax=Brassica campestris TaxID=3711 RepID=M4D7E6_BRACM
MCKELEKEDAVATDVYMDALGLMLRLDTRDKLPEFLDRLKVLADCLTDQLFDITTIWALSKVGNSSQAHVLLEGLKSRTCNLNNKKQQLMQKMFRGRRRVTSWKAEAIVTTCEKANVLESSYFKFA